MAATMTVQQAKSEKESGDKGSKGSGKEFMKPPGRGQYQGDDSD